MSAHARRRVRLECSGIVQGVGFRPFVHQAAVSHGLVGFVFNHADGVTAEFEGDPAAVDACVARIRGTPPPLSRIERFYVEELAPRGDETRFSITESRAGEGGGAVTVSPDVSTCADCLREILDPADRRHRYPFANCTNCGPRYSIIRALPYDRPATAMAGFPLCPACAAEYADPADRRFHAQPVCCPACGPHLALLDPAGRPLLAEASDDAVVSEAARRLAAGEAVAVKGLGGFHLAARPGGPGLEKLRRFKNRREKPLAVMAASFDVISNVCAVSPAERALLESAERPIVLLPLLPGSPLAATAPGLAHAGVMLPYTPLHHLLLAQTAALGHPFLVMTSANAAGEPICADDAEVIDRLAPCLDAILTHDRPIVARVDDTVLLAGGTGGATPDEGTGRGFHPLGPRRGSRTPGPPSSAAPLSGAYAPDRGAEGDREVWRVADPPAGSRGGAPAVPSSGSPSPRFVRRSRGFAPGAVPIARRRDAKLLCLGGDLKCVFALVAGGRAILSPHVGDLEHPESQDFLLETIDHLAALHRFSPDEIVVDAHPGYHGPRAIAARHPGVPRRAVFHHEAHAGAILGEHGAEAPAVVLSFDGTGYGRDGTIWGGEILAVTEAGIRRAGRFRPLPLAGGDAAVKSAARIGLSYLAGILGGEIAAVPAPLLAGREELARVVALQVARGVNVIPCSSLGRLFDAAAGILGVRDAVSYEGQAAMELEARCDPAEAGNFPLPLTEAEGMIELDSGALVLALADAARAGTDPARAAMRFHRAVAGAAAAAAIRVAEEIGASAVGLSGGCFLNRRLSALVRSGLEAAGLAVLEHRLVPPGDGGICYGQAWVVDRYE